MNTRKRIVLKPWAQVLLVALGGALLAFIAYVVTNAIQGDDDGTPHRQPPLSREVPVNPEKTTSTPTNDWGEYNPNSIEVCKILDGVYIDSAAEAKSLDERLYGYYQGVQEESMILSGFIEDLHEPDPDIDFLNEQLTHDIPDECEEQTP